MGTRAHWFSHRWRYQEEDSLGWTYAETLADVKADAEEISGPVKVQRRTGTKSFGYTYEDHSTINKEG